MVESSVSPSFVDIEPSPESLRELVSKHGTFVLYDVRNRDEVIATGVIAETRYVVPLPFLQGRHFPDDKTQALVFTCARGRRGGFAAQKAVDLGYVNVYNIRGGLGEWIANGHKAENAEHYVDEPSVKFFYEKATATCQYVVTDDETRETVIIDSVLDFNPETNTASLESVRTLVHFCREYDLKVIRILETHVHADHLTGAQFLARELSGIAHPQNETVEDYQRQLDEDGKMTIPICIGEGVIRVQQHFGAALHQKDILENKGRYFDCLLKDNEEWKLGKLQCTSLATPGHTPDSMSYVIGNNTVFGGDTLFMHDFGSARCDFPNGSAHELYESVKSRLYGLPGRFRLYVGHDYMPNGRPLQFEQKLEEQKKLNIHIRHETDREEFVQMRTERDKTLKAPRLLQPSIQVNLRAGRLAQGMQLKLD